jgi:flagellar biosynthesis GTPase FlhF
MTDIKSIKKTHLLFDNRRTAEIECSFAIGDPQSNNQIIARPIDNICYMRERNIHMLKNELILKNPLRRMGYESDDILNNGEFGAVMARAGVGKTAFLVQLALNSMLREKKSSAYQP